MRDSSGAGTLGEFYARHIEGRWATSLVQEAIKTLHVRSEPIRNGFSITGRAPKNDRFRGASFDWSPLTFGSDEPRVYKVAAVRSPLENRQIVDATLAYKMRTHADFAVAILDPQGERENHSKSSSDTYWHRYKALAWHGLGIAWFVADRLEEEWTLPATPLAAPCDWLDDLSRELSAALNQAVIDLKEISDDSRLAEKLVCPIFDTSLAKRGFSKEPSSKHEMFWCPSGVKADGLWTREGHGPQSIALEVKVTEDVEAPFCQAMENLGEFDAVFHVRIVTPTARAKLTRLQVRWPQIATLKAKMQNAAPVRFLEILVPG